MIEADGSCRGSVSIEAHDWQRESIAGVVVAIECRRCGDTPLDVMGRMEIEPVNDDDWLAEIKRFVAL